MRKINLTPDSNGYSFTDANEMLMAELDGGMPRVRRDIINGALTATVSYTLGRDEYDYIRRFYRVAIAQDGGKFLSDLIIDDADLTEHECMFVPGTMKLTSQRGLTYVVSVTIKCIPIPMDLDFEGSLIDMIDAYGSQEAALEIMNLFNELANVNLAAI